MAALLVIAGTANATPPLTLDILAKHPDSYLGDKIQVRGYLGGNVLFRPFLYASVEDANQHRDSAALDAISDDTSIRKALHVSKPTCVIVTGIFNVVGKDGHIGAFGFSGFAYINIQSMQSCEGA